MITDLMQPQDVFWLNGWGEWLKLRLDTEMLMRQSNSNRGGGYEKFKD